VAQALADERGARRRDPDRHPRSRSGRAVRRSHRRDGRRRAIVADGPPSTILADPAVQRAFAVTFHVGALGRRQPVRGGAMSFVSARGRLTYARWAALVALAATLGGPS
jgi:hypothetical protein